MQNSLVRPLRIGIDGEALRTPLSGIGQYVYHLCRELEQLLPDAQFFAYSRLGTDRLKLPSARWQLRQEAVPTFQRVPSYLWLKTRGKALCQADDLDVFWAGRTLHPGLSSPVRTVSTVHDLNHLLVPETMQRAALWSHRLWFERDLRAADCIVTNSRGTAQRLRDKLGIASDGVVVPGVDSAFHPLAQGEAEQARTELAALGIETPYLLSVATLEPRKNVETIFRAFLSLKRAGELPKERLVLVGAKGWHNQALERELRAASAEGVVVAGYVPDRLMPALYASAKALVFPSLYEGFGMPVLEARACGTRVVISDLLELREAGGPTAIVVEPNLTGVSNGILQAMNADPLSSPATWQHPSWRSLATQLLSLLTPAQSSAEFAQSA